MRVKVAKKEKSHGWFSIAAIFVGEREQSLERVKKMEVGKWECGGGRELAMVELCFKFGFWFQVEVDFRFGSRFQKKKMKIFFS